MKVIYDTEDLELSALPQTSLLELCLKEKLPLSHSCEGMGSCGTCRVFILSGLENLPPRNDIEQEMARDRGFKAHERLACQLTPRESLSFKLPQD